MPWPIGLGQAPFPCEPAMHSDEAASTAAEAACEQGHSGVRSFGGQQKKGAGRRKRFGLHKTLQCGEGISTGMSREASVMGSADLGRHQEAEGEAEGIESGH